MSREVYERLLAECREEWIVAGGQTFNLEVFAPSSSSTSNPPFSRDDYELLANVNVPMDSDRSLFTLGGFAVLRKNVRTDHTREVFARLCNEAGAHLPPDIGKQLGDFCTWDKRGPASRWVGLMLYMKGEVACYPDGTYREHLCITQPFRAYAEAIQTCRLNTDQPVFPAVTITDEEVTITTPDSHVPVEDPQRYASLSDGTNKRKKRGRPKADYATERKEADLADAWEQARESGIAKVDFAEDNGMMEKDLNKLLDRVYQRNKCSDK